MALTIAMLAASAALVVGIYFRDRATPSWQPPQQPLARRDAQQVLTELAGSHCSRGCTIELVRHPGRNRWVARLHLRSLTECYEIDLRAFGWTRSGLTGAQEITCPRRPAHTDR
jgi:hypothetical protein